MAPRALAPSPFARLLLDLAERGADGRIDVGGRRLVLRGGELHDVVKADSDPSLETFLRGTGRLTDESLARAKAEAPAHEPLERTISRAAGLNSESLAMMRRSLWLERFVSGIAEDERAGRTTPWFVPEVGPTSSSHRVALVPFLLDALFRRAADGDAEIVGTQADHRLEWLDTPHRERALRWAPMLSDASDRSSVRDLLAVEPAAASRIATLVRAGIARLVAPRASAPPPPRRPITIAPPAPSADESPRRSVRIIPPPVDDTPLSPGSGVGHELPRDLATPLAPLPEQVVPLEDPLDPIERRIAKLEQAGAPGPERAAAWRELGRTWQQRYGSLEEAARALREASAADPTDPLCLEQAAIACGALGKPQLAVAYAEAAAAATTVGEERGRLERLAATFARRAGQPNAALEWLERASQDDPADGATHELLARVRLARGDVDVAVERTRLAAQLGAKKRPDRSLALLISAVELRPADLGIARAFADLLAESTNPTVAASWMLSHALGLPAGSDERRAFLFHAAERAEAAGRAEASAAALLELLEEEPLLEILYEPLASYVDAAFDGVERAVLLEEIALGLHEEARGAWLARAGRAWLDVPSGNERAVPLLAIALSVDPGNDATLLALRAAATTDTQRAIVGDALEAAAVNAVATPEQRHKLLILLADLDDMHLDGTYRASWARARAAELVQDAENAQLTAERWRDAERASTDAVESIERELNAAPGASRLDLARQLGIRLASHPGRRDRAKELLREVAAARPDDDVAAEQLERVLLATQQLVELATLSVARADAAESDTVRVRRLLRAAAFAGLASAQGTETHTLCVEVLTRALSLHPGHPEARMRLVRLGKRRKAPALERLALESPLRDAAPTPKERARESVQRAEVHLRDARPGDAAALAHEALTLDPQLASAVWILVRTADFVDAEVAADALERSRALAGDLPQILSPLARAYGRAGDAQREAQAYAAWAHVAPLDPEPILTALEAATRTTDVALIREALFGALALELTTPSAATTAREAIERIAELGDPREAATLALHVLDRLGGRDTALKQLALDQAVLANAPALQLATLERITATTPEVTRKAPLEALVERHRTTGDRAAEARTLLRLLALDMTNDTALARLQEIYAQAGEAERLLAVLSLRREAARDARTKIDRLLELASVAAQLAGDRDRAATFLHEAISLATDGDGTLERTAGMLVTLGLPKDAVRALVAAAERSTGQAAEALALRAVAVAELVARDLGLGLQTTARLLDHLPNAGTLLVSFERLALAAGDVELARNTYTKLIERAMGPHGRRALHYRAARWLERSAEPLLALEQYEKAFELAPTSGVVLKAIERIAKATGKFDVLARACIALAERTPYVALRADLLRRAAEAYEEGGGDLMRGFDLRMQAWETGGRIELEQEVVVVARKLRARSRAEGDVAFERVLEVLRARAEKSWEASDRLVVETRIARIIGDELHKPDDAARVLRTAINAAAREGLEPSHRSDAVCELATLLVAAGRDGEAIELLDAVLASSPDHERARALRLDAMARSRGLSPDEASARDRDVDEGAVAVDVVTLPGTVLAPSVEKRISSTLPPKRPDDDVAPVQTNESAQSESARAPLLPAGALVVAASASEHPSVVATRELEPEPSPAPSTAATYEVRAAELASPSPEPVAPETAQPTQAPIAVASLPEASAAPMPASPSAPSADTSRVAEESPSASPAEDTQTPAVPAEARLPAAPPLPAAPRVTAPLPTSLDVPASVPRAASIPPEALRQAYVSDDEAAAEELIATYGNDPQGLHEAAHVLRTFLRRDPSRTRALRALLVVAARLGSKVEAEVLAEIIGSFDATRRTPHPETASGALLAIEHAVDRTEATALIEDEAVAPQQIALAALWDSGLPTYRRSAASAGVSAANRVVPGIATALTRAWSAVNALFAGDEVALHLLAQPNADIRPVPTVPACVAAGADIGEDEHTLRFRLGRAAALALPERLLVTSLPQPDAQRLVHALTAAFGPAEHPVETTRDVTQLAAELWTTVPPRVQQRVREALARAQGPIAHDALLASAQLSAAKAGLLACGDVRVALEACVQEERAAGHDVGVLGSEQDFVRACKTSSVFAGLVRFALSDAFLAARARARFV